MYGDKTNSGYNDNVVNLSQIFTMYTGSITSPFVDN